MSGWSAHIGKEGDRKSSHKLFSARRWTPGCGARPWPSADGWVIELKQLPGGASLENGSLEASQHGLALQSCSLSLASGHSVHPGGGVHVPQGFGRQLQGQAL